MVAEAVRHIETDDGALPGADLVEASLTDTRRGLETLILERAMQLGVEIGISESIAKAKSMFERSTWLLQLAALALGGAAASRAVAAEQGTINFYWLLIVLLGLNLVTLLAWCILTVLHRGHDTPGGVGKLPAAMLRRWARRLDGARGYYSQAAQGYASVYFRGPGGKWTLGGISHGFWFSYLLGGTVLIIFQFMTRQFDFVWETTLLPESVFINLTNWLAQLPHALGLEIPTQYQVSSSRPGADTALLAEARGAWAGLLILSLVLYGLVPRLILWLACRMAAERSRSRQPLDLGIPYYVNLRQRLVPVSEALGVTDADTGTTGGTETATAPATGLQPPDNARWAGLEIATDEPWLIGDGRDNTSLGAANDGTSQRQLLDKITGITEPLVVAIPLARAADRGLSQLLEKLVLAHGGSTWLGLLEDKQGSAMNPAERTARATDWYRLAAKCGIPADRVFHYRAATPA